MHFDWCGEFTNHHKRKNVVAFSIVYVFIIGVITLLVIGRSYLWKIIIRKLFV